MSGSASILLLCAVCAHAASDVQRGYYNHALFSDGMPIYDDPVVNEAVARIGKKVVTASKNPLGFDFRFTILNISQPTAFAAPGGLVYITTGLLRSVANEDELAAAIGHEVGHVNQRHGMKTGMSPKAQAFWSTMLALGTAAATAYVSSVISDALSSHNDYWVLPGRNGQAVYLPVVDYTKLMPIIDHITRMATSEVGQRIVVSFYKGYKDEFEFQADELAVQYAGAAGYRPEAAVDLLERLQSKSGYITSPAISHLHSPKKVLDQRTAKLKTLIAQGRSHGR